MDLKCPTGVALALAAICVGCQQERPSDRFHRGRDFLIQGRFASADSELAAFEKEHPGHELSSRATFLRAKASMGTGDLPGARQRFEETIERFPNSEEAAKASYKLAVIDLLEGDEAESRRRFQAIVDRSNSILVAEATAMLEMLSGQQDE